MTAPTPQPGQVVRVRQRRWLVNDVDHGATFYESPLVRLSCLDDDAAGDYVEVLWRHEIDAAIEPDTPKLMDGSEKLDAPALFGAYLHALRWHTVTSTDKRLLQAPFRAGIDLKPYQLEPLRKALELPRVNEFIADDVGLGKTIEAGLVLQELLLRQRIDRVLVVAPPAVTVQWQEELEQRFGLRFVIYDREYVTQRRRERGFGINPWTTHNRFIVSYPRLRGTRGRDGAQHLELLLSSLGERAPRSLLILDECHQVAPSTGSLYPVDSQTTHAIRQLASRFEHRLFLSATPHNGHSSSFASLLHLLDPQRFTRGVPISSAKELAPVMVRRLKRDLRGEVDGLPERHLVDHVLDVAPSAPEIVLADKLAEYDRLYRDCLKGLSQSEQDGRGYVMVNLHKRLLSSVTAFLRTLRKHESGARTRLSDARQVPMRMPPSADDDLDEDARDEEDDAFVERASFDAGQQATALLDEMLAVATKNAERPDARAVELAAWINKTLCPSRRWGSGRVVVFTEYQDTLGWLNRILPGLLDADPTDRIATYTGQIGTNRREELKAAFNAPPDAHPLRILLATDAAREGINLQAHCEHLFHFDLPWNPSRIEQRNGRIDRVLQPAEHIYCHYFVIASRPEDKVLDYLVRKLHRIREELGSLSEVISARLATQLEKGLRGIDEEDIDDLADPGARARQAQAELEGEGAEQLRGDLEVLGRQLERSRRAVDYRPEHLQALIDLGLRMVSPDKQGLKRIPGQQDPEEFELPALDESWNAILEPMRERLPDRERRWVVPPVRPVAFRAAHRLDAATVQLHLGHPLVKRLVARFRAQGFAAHDLSRVTALENPKDTSRRVVMFGRLALFGPGATRLHEELIAVAARVGTDALEPFGGAGEATTVEWLEEALAEGPRALASEAAQNAVRRRVGRDAEVLWRRLEGRASEAEGQARTALATRGQQESEAMTALLLRQRKTIEGAIAQHGALQGDMFLDDAKKEERAQFERDRHSLDDRLVAISSELEDEPESIRASYRVVLRRFEPVGVAYLWSGV